MTHTASVTRTEKRRYTELDALRGIAVLLMAIYHLFYDLDVFYEWNIGIEGEVWNIFAKSTASLFLLLVGISFVISWERTPKSLRLWKVFRRAILILAGAMIISLVTWMSAGDAFVKFGILHLIGISVLLQPFMKRLRHWNLPLGVVVFLLGMQIASITTTSMFLFPFGLRYSRFQSIDYYPLLPWFGVVLIGMGIGEFLYRPAPLPWLKPLQSLSYPRWLLWSGRRAYILYFLHQPVILAVLAVLFGKPY
ncbi:MAG: DUF1624 domain-containing protein [Candidatus Peregrinibacteria bacterium]|nr:DUF1624 domain-containing protein [Candidatus Peregrinibacteria bacterium]